MPRVTPVMPPILEAKSNQVIFSALENSTGERESEGVGRELKVLSDRFTKCRRLAKKDVHHSNVPFISIVDGVLLRVTSTKI